jgi:hypothetical protein
MKILSTLLLLGLCAAAQSDGYADTIKPAEAKPSHGDDSQHWKFLESPGSKRKNPKTTTHPDVRGPIWKSRLRR